MKTFIKQTNECFKPTVTPHCKEREKKLETKMKVFFKSTNIGDLKTT